MEKKTAITELMEIVEMDYNNGVEISMKVFYSMLKEALVKERQQMIDFALWLKENDTPENAEMFFGFSDDDMLHYFLNIKQ